MKNLVKAIGANVLLDMAVGENYIAVIAVESQACIPSEVTFW